MSPIRRALKLSLIRRANKSGPTILNKDYEAVRIRKKCKEMTLKSTQNQVLGSDSFCQTLVPVSVERKVLNKR